MHQHRAGGRETAILAIAKDYGYLNERDDQLRETAGAPIVSRFNKRCFLRCRCSMEMWCPDDIGRDSWDWVWPPTGESMIQLPRVGWKLLAC